MNPKQVCDLFEKLDADRGTIKSVFDDIQKFVTPNRDGVTIERSKGTTNSATRYDSTAVHANKLLASRIQAAVIPATSKWFNIRFRDDDLNKDNEVQDWLDDTTDRMQSAFNASNFNTVLHEAFLDLGSYGTTNVLMLEQPRDVDGEFTGLTFQRWGCREYVFWEGKDKKPIGVMRKFKLTAEAIKNEFENQPGFKGFGKTIQETLDAPNEKKYTEKYEIIHAIFENSGKVDARAENKPFKSVYIAVKDKHTIRESGFNEFPNAIARWDRNDDDAGWGRSPAWVALSEIRTLNRVKELNLKNISKQVSPPLIVTHKGVIGGLRVRPNAVNVIRPDADVRYLETRQHTDLVKLEIGELQAQINQIFFIDRLQLPDKPDMTATEAQIRFQQMLQLLGSTFFRLSDELLNPIVIRAFNLMLAAGAFLPVPQAIKESQDSTFDVVFDGPLARTQRQEEVFAIESTYQKAAMIAEVRQDPSILDNLDDDEALKVIAEQTGLPAKILRAQDEVEESRQARAEAMQQQAAMDEAQQGLEIEQQAQALEQ